jgi:ankyrin repeat protein
MSIEQKFFEAVKINNIDKVKFYLEDKLVDVNVKDEVGHTALYFL